MVPVTGAVRAYFGPVNKATGAPTWFDASASGRFDVATPPTGWISPGWISDFKRTSATKYVPVRAGTQEQVNLQVRTQPDALLQFQFREWGKLQMALACGTQHFNLLAEADAGVIAAAPVSAGSTASALAMSAASLAQFRIGDVIAVDVDYAQQTGYVGTGISAAYVTSAQATLLDVNYIRRVTFQVAKVASITKTQLMLEEPLPGGAPLAGSGAQKITGFQDREGSSFFQEWSALFVADGAQGDRMCFYYPRLQAMSGAGEAAHGLSPELEQVGLMAQFRALPVADATDGETVLCYRSYLPAGGPVY
jgi:hypothetical protein